MKTRDRVYHPLHALVFLMENGMMPEKSVNPSAMNGRYTLIFVVVHLLYNTGHVINTSYATLKASQKVQK